MAKQLLTTRQLNKMRDTAERLLPSTCVIYRRTLSDDGNGGKATTYTETETVDCRLVFYSNRPGAPDRTQGGKVRAADLFLLSVPQSTDIRETDRVEINGTTYDVVSDLAERSYEVTKRVLVKKV